MTRLRLLKLVVQPVFVQDDGTALTELPQQPVEVAAADWPEFPVLLELRRAEAEQALNAPGPDEITPAEHAPEVAKASQTGRETR